MAVLSWTAWPGIQKPTYLVGGRVAAAPARAWRNNGGNPRTHPATPHALTADIALFKKTLGYTADIAISKKLGGNPRPR